jgi:uncharacterized protein
MSTVLEGLVGSHAYGYATSESDLDWMSVYVGNLSDYFGLSKGKTKHSVSQEVDITQYEFLEFVKLCVNFNPNVIPLLFLEDSAYRIRCCQLGSALINIRNAFVTKKALVALMGYAVSQERKVKENITEKHGQKRKDLIVKYGYDVKAAAHTVRLLHLAKHLFLYDEVRLTEGSDECLEIRTGKYSKEDFENRFSVLKTEVQKAFDGNTTLPDSPDLLYINTFCTHELSNYFSLNY